MTDRTPLAVWLYGTHVGVLDDAEGDFVSLRWTLDAVERWGLNSRVVSNLLPLSRPDRPPHRLRVKAFVDGLLPEGHARTNYAFEAGLRPDDSFGLLSAYGRDTAGALIFQPLHDPEPTNVGSYRSIDDTAVTRRLREADKRTPVRTSGRLRDSSTLAGVQPKITAHRTDAGRWQACLDGAPSTWIIKLAQPQDAPAADVVDTEVLSLDLTRRTGLHAAYAAIEIFDGIRTITVLRYDRHRTADGVVDRIHQEDLAQATGLNTAEPLRKFQRGNTMPSFRQAAQVLNNGGAEPDELLHLMTVNYVLGNIDAHAKNISFLRFADGTAALAPAYDIAMHLHHPDEPHRSALDINNKTSYDELTGTDLIAEGVSWGMPARRVRQRVLTTVHALVDAIDEIDPDDYPGVSASALSTVRGRATRTFAELSPTSAPSSQPNSGSTRPSARKTVSPVRRPGGPRRRRPKMPDE